ncbi:zinc/manganese transport system substrate-binding protein [Neomicrococcus aestuarii]|uniref:Zinc/manganese transport system substrate-binding protein n=1 Tax=Neomicrococcus aestuarii TaxID=556325 RepID=A0A7W8WZX8_9MICC|nr:zinc ABC transporter substrate-binding protein [Neomicrococcus aestuarii]MBB5513891.1 zinc/manganese transport system substrate-binding protein [Neomicrococcus aestuarii]
MIFQPSTPLKRRALMALALPAAMMLAACGESSTATSSAGAADAGIFVVASTNVYGNIAEQIGGEHVSVDSIINRETQDPHSYEATAQDRLTVSKASLVIANGGGYDDYLDQLVASDSTPVLHAVDFADSPAETDVAESSASATTELASEDAHDGHDHSGSGNEHVWYDLHTMEALAEGIKDQLVTADPDNADSYEANTKTFVASLEALTERTHALAEKNAGKKFAMTEPVPYYLLAETGFADATPEGFTSAIEAGNDVPALVALEMEDALKAKTFAFLAFNPQTSTPQTDSIRGTAEDNGIPVLDFLELLPEGKNFQEWMSENISSIEGVSAK